jgi:RNA polymerase sigma-54 factor
MLKQGLYQKLLQKLSPQQIQLMKLLQVPTASLEQRIKEELEENPALEEGAPDDIAEEETKDNEDEEIETSEEETSADEKEDYSDEEVNEAMKEQDSFDIADYIEDDDVPYYKLNVNNSSPDDDRPESPVVVTVTFQDTLLSQLGLSDIDDREYLIGQHLIGSLDDDGYIRRDLNAIADDLAFTQNIETTPAELEHVLKVIQTLDPPGIAARSLQECLMIQLLRKKGSSKAVDVAIKIIDRFMEEFSRKHYDKIAKSLNLFDEQLKEAIDEILALNPKPGGGSSEDARTSSQITPDFILIVNNDQLELSLNSKNDPDLRISRSFQEMLKSYATEKKNKATREAVTFIKQKIDAARWFIDAIQQRQHTLLTTMNAIMNYQKEYFLDGDERKLRPMILKDIADLVALDISTVSRVANSKYVETPYGTFLLKTFFSESLTTDSGEEVSSREVKKILQDAIEAEDKRKPLPDEKLMEILNDKGYNIARRTIAKYREQLNIPVARLRKQL